MTIYNVKTFLLALLLVNLWLYSDLAHKIIELPDGKYKNLIIFHGRTDMKIISKSGLEWTPNEYLWNYLDGTEISSYSLKEHNGQFDLYLYNINEKEEALRLLREGIYEGKIYVDHDNYLVIE